MALGQVAGQSPEATGLDHLLRFCQSRLFDASLGMPAAWQFADLAEHYLNQVCVTIPLPVFRKSREGLPGIYSKIMNSKAWSSLTLSHSWSSLAV